ncbi:Peroxiredoxin [Solimonas aquatica]|uniref:Peroxiredoxin n=1 Tax=Solimonas aquatica TaxID=489703 RepID=A0A1H9M5Q9_9GAMM|nr:TlpA disulfide reductase family protein [Solimonas aquatica]SER18805.1 Peroxiredoxin [Solimonas aquatica]
MNTHRLGRALLAGLTGLLLAGSAQAAEVGKPAPDFTLAQKDGNSLSLTQLRGRVVYLDFWASWCAPCRQSFPFMNEMHAKYGKKGLRVVAINVDEQRSDAEQFLKQTPAQFTVLFDPAGKAPEQYKPDGMPTSYLIDEHGKVLMVHPSFKEADRAELERRIGEALAQGNPAP